LRGNRLGAAVVAVALLGAAVGAQAAAPADRILAVDQYTSAKARNLAVAYAAFLRELNSGIYHCMPWVEVQKQSIGFFKPRHLTQDDRYLSIRIYIDQDPSPAFAGLDLQERAAAMFSRYVGPLLRRMTAGPGLLDDAAVDGFTTVIEWLKQVPVGRDRPVHETIAVFTERAVARDYVAGRLGSAELARQTQVLGWDGDRPLGRMRLSAWDDNFVATFKLKNYQLEPGVTCPGDRAAAAD
jgi:hypothetical protein